MAVRDRNVAVPILEGAGGFTRQNRADVDLIKSDEQPLALRRKPQTEKLRCSEQLEDQLQFKFAAPYRKASGMSGLPRFRDQSAERQSVSGWGRKPRVAVEWTPQWFLWRALYQMWRRLSRELYLPRASTTRPKRFGQSTEAIAKREWRIRALRPQAIREYSFGSSFVSFQFADPYRSDGNTGRVCLFDIKQTCWNEFSGYCGILPGWMGYLRGVGAEGGERHSSAPKERFS
jgi:hypothetical protein